MAKNQGWSNSRVLRPHPTLDMYYTTYTPAYSPLFYYASHPLVWVGFWSFRSAPFSRALTSPPSTSLTPLFLLLLFIARSLFFCVGTRLFPIATSVGIRRLDTAIIVRTTRSLSFGTSSVDYTQWRWGILLRFHVCESLHPRS